MENPVKCEHILGEILQRHMYTFITNMSNDKLVYTCRDVGCLMIFISMYNKINLSFTAVYFIHLKIKAVYAKTTGSLYVLLEN